MKDLDVLKAVAEIVEETTGQSQASVMEMPRFDEDDQFPYVNVAHGGGEIPEPVSELDGQLSQQDVELHLVEVTAFALTTDSQKGYDAADGLSRQISTALLGAWKAGELEAVTCIGIDLVGSALVEEPELTAGGNIVWRSSRTYRITVDPLGDQN